MRLAGLDLATTSGFALMVDGAITRTTTVRAPAKLKNILEVGPTIDPRHEGRVTVHFEDALLVWLRDEKPDHVGIEAPIPSNTTKKTAVIRDQASFHGQAITYTEKAGTSQAAIFRIYGLEMSACAMCYRLNIPVTFIGQTTWRKEFLGNGRPKNPKAEAVKMCRKLGIEISSVDAAEAVGVAWALNTIINPYTHKANSLFRLAPTTRSEMAG